MRNEERKAHLFAVARLRRLGPIAVLMVLLCNGTAQAQENRGTAEQRDACTPDAFRLCSSYIPDATNVENCLRQRKSDLSDRCRSVFGYSRASDRQQQINAATR